MSATCEDCEHVAFNTGGLHCCWFSEQIPDRDVAAECPQFDPAPTGAPVLVAAVPVRGKIAVPLKILPSSLEVRDVHGRVAQAPRAQPVFMDKAGERELVLSMVVRYFGKPNHGQGIWERTRQMLEGEFLNVSVTRTADVAK